MKRKQVMALLLTGMLTVGSVTPVHAQEGADPAQNPVQAQEEEVKEAAPEVKDDTSVQAPEENKVQEPAKEEVAPQPSNEDKKTEAEMPELTTTQAMVDSAKAEVLSMVEKIKEIDDYLEANDPDLQWTLQEYIGTNMPGVESRVNYYIEKYFKVEDPEFADCADSITAQLDDWYAYGCELKLLAEKGQKEYSEKQVALSIAAMTKLLKEDAVLYKPEYVNKVKAALEEARAVVVTEENAADVVDLVNGWNTLLDQGQLNLDDEIYRDFIDFADSYLTLYSLAPESIKNASDPVVTVDKNYTYSEYVVELAEMKTYMEARKEKLNDGTLSVSEAREDKDYFYGNGRTVWSNTVTAIAKDGREFLDKVKALGAKTDEYESALVYLEQHETLINDYGVILSSAQKLQAAREKIENSARDMLEKAMVDMQKVYDRITADCAQGYIEDEYIQNLEKAMKEYNALLKDESTDNEVLMEAAQYAEYLVSQETENYTNDLYGSFGVLRNDNRAAAYILSAATAEYKEKYADVVKKAQEYVQFVEDQQSAIKSGKAADLETLVKLLEETKKDHAKDGVIHTAIVDVVENDLLPNAEALLKEEKNKEHTEGLVHYMDTAVTNLKKVYAQWLEDGVCYPLQDGVEFLVSASESLRKDTVSTDPDTKPVTKPDNTTDKKDDKKKEDKKKEDTKKKAAHTGDNTEAGGAGLLALASAAVLAGMKKKRP